MKHKFLLDENILYLAVKGVDEYDHPDSGAAELIRLIAQNCHTIIVHSSLRYWYHLRKLEGFRPPVLETVFFIKELMKNSVKIQELFTELADVPIGVEIPSEDIHIVRIALTAHPVIVSSDHDLREAVNDHVVLQLRALDIGQAIALAREK